MENVHTVWCPWVTIRACFILLATLGTYIRTISHGCLMAEFPGGYGDCTLLSFPLEQCWGVSHDVLNIRDLFQTLDGTLIFPYVYLFQLIFRVYCFCSAVVFDELNLVWWKRGEILDCRPSVNMGQCLLAVPSRIYLQKSCVPNVVLTPVLDAPLHPTHSLLENG